MEAYRIERACLVVLVSFVFVCLYFVGIFPGAGDANQRSHYQMLRALGERGTAEIGPELRDLGSHTDVAVHGGHPYSDKAPGLAVAALPAYWTLRRFLPAPRSPQDWFLFYAARVFSVTLTVVVALWVFMRRAIRAVPAAPWLPLWLFALLFATPFQVYARSFFSHAFAAALVFLSFSFVIHGRGLATGAAAGFLAGFAVATEYPLAVLALSLLVTAALRGPGARLAAFLGGAAAPAAALGGYQAHYFGSVFATPPASSVTYPMLAGRGLAGISWPSPAAILGLFVDPTHGLLYFSPFMILWPIVAIACFRRFKKDSSLVASALGPLLLLLVIAGFLPPHWRGGWCLGPRYLVAGFLLVFWLFVVRLPSGGPLATRFSIFVAVVYGAAVLAVCGSTFWLIPYESWNPARTVSAHFLRRGVVEYNLGLASGLPPLLSLLPPVAAVGVAFFAAARAAVIPRRFLAAGTLVGLLAAVAVISIRPSPTAVANSHRDGLASVLLPTMRAGWR